MTGKPHKAHLHVIDAGDGQKIDRREDDSVVTSSSVLSDMAYGVGAAAFGVSVIALAGASFGWAPATPSLGDSPWLSGSQNAIKVTTLVLAVAAFAVPVHVAIWLPAKALFLASYVWRKIEALVADIAMALAMMALILVVAISASPGIVAQFRHSTQPQPHTPPSNPFRVEAPKTAPQVLEPTPAPKPIPAATSRHLALPVLFQAYRLSRRHRLQHHTRRH